MKVVFMRLEGFSLRFWKVCNQVQSSALLSNNFRTLFLRFAGMKLDQSARLAENVYLGAKNLVMKKGTFVNVGAFIDGSAAVVLEEYVRVGPYVKILTGTHRMRNSPLRRWPKDPTLGKPVCIMRGCWVGIGAIILPGVTIGEGCVIAAGALVAKDTEPHGLYGGVPAKRLKDLPLNETIPPEYMVGLGQKPNLHTT
jgi:acetyltransferase-like isoleucine patch superfamily enzyme